MNKRKPKDNFRNHDQLVKQPRLLKKPGPKTLEPKSFKRTVQVISPRNNSGSSGAESSEYEVMSTIDVEKELQKDKQTQTGKPKSSKLDQQVTKPREKPLENGRQTEG